MLAERRAQLVAEEQGRRAGDDPSAEGEAEPLGDTGEPSKDSSPATPTPDSRVPSETSGPRSPAPPRSRQSARPHPRDVASASVANDTSRHAH